MNEEKQNMTIKDKLNDIAKQIINTPVFDEEIQNELVITPDDLKEIMIASFRAGCIMERGNK